MTVIRPNTKLSELIDAALADKAISLLELPVDLEYGTPPALLAVAIGYNDIQLLLDTVRPVTEIFGLNNGEAQLKGMHFPVSGVYPGYSPKRIKVFENVIDEAHNQGRILTVLFREWTPQGIPASMFVAATGQRYCEMLTERIRPALLAEEKLKQEKALTSYKDLPQETLDIIYESETEN